MDLDETMQNIRMIDRRLLVLRTLAQVGTVAATAEALDYTPSAVSAQLRGLADRVGVELLEPAGRRVRLTAAGRVLVERSDQLFASWERIRAEVIAQDDTEQGLLRVCGFSTAAAALLPALVGRLRIARPGLRVQIEEAEPALCFERLLVEKADLAVVIGMQDVPASSDPRFEQRALLTDPLDLLVAADHVLAARTSASFTEVAAEQWITDRVGSPYHQLFLTACLGAGFVPDIAHHVMEWDTAAAMVAAGLGTALIPRLARLPEGYPVCRVRLHGASAPARSVLVAIRAGSGSHPSIAAAIDQLARIADDLALS